MRRNPGVVGSSLLLIALTLVLATLMGAMIPMLNGGGLPSMQAKADVDPTAAIARTVVAPSSTPAVVAEAVGRSDGTIGSVMMSTPAAVPPIASEGVVHVAKVTSATQVPPPAPTEESLTVVLEERAAAAASPVAPASAADPAAMPKPRATHIAVASTPMAPPTPTAVPQRTATVAARPELTQHSQPAPSAKPNPSPTVEAAAVAAIVPDAPELLAPPAESRLAGLVQFAWQPSVVPGNGLAYEIVVWAPDQDPNQARGIAPPTLGTALQVNLDRLFESGRFREGSLYWTVLVVQQEPYTRLTLPADSPQRYLVYTEPGS